MKSHLWILLLTGIYPFQAMALLASALETANDVTNTAADVTSDVAHTIGEPVGDATDVALDATVGTVERITTPRRVYGPYEGFMIVEEDEE